MSQVVAEEQAEFEPGRGAGGYGGGGKGITTPHLQKTE